MSRSLLKELVRTHHDSIAATPRQHAVLRCIKRCQTAEAGTHTIACTGCGHLETRYNSCRNRHCPCCQDSDRQRWVREREAELLPVPYFHVVCTAPHDLLPFARFVPKWFYDTMMRCSRTAIADLCRDPKYLGATPGQIQVLHTWGSDLKLHPHVHSIVTGGGLDEHQNWVDAPRRRKRKRPFLVPVAALRKRFRTIMIGELKKAFRAGVCDGMPDYSDARAFSHLCGRLCRKEWVVYAKRPFHSPEVAIRYLGRYTHRVAVHPNRLTATEDGRYGLDVKGHSGRPRQTLILTGTAFLQRFVQHILPKHFRRIRMAGFLAPRTRRASLAAIRKQLAHRHRRSPADSLQPPRSSLLSSKRCCSHCGGTLITISLTRPRRGGLPPLTIIPQPYKEVLARARALQTKHSPSNPLPLHSRTEKRAMIT